MTRPISLTFSVAAANAAGYVSGATGASITLTATTAGDGLGRPVSFTSTANLSAINLTVVGFDADGRSITETLAAPNNNTVSTTEYFERVVSITPSATLGANTMNIGWGSAAQTKTIAINWRSHDVSVRTIVSGTINYDLQQTFDRFEANYTASASLNQNDLDWSDCTDTNLVGATASQITTYDKPVTGLRFDINSYSSTPTLGVRIVQADV